MVSGRPGPPRPPPWFSDFNLPLAPVGAISMSRQVSVEQHCEISTRLLKIPSDFVLLCAPNGFGDRHCVRNLKHFFGGVFCFKPHVPNVNFVYVGFGAESKISVLSATYVRPPQFTSVRPWMLGKLPHFALAYTTTVPVILGRTRWFLLRSCQLQELL
jgi:hypothetical protein